MALHKNTYGSRRVSQNWGPSEFRDMKVGGGGGSPLHIWGLELFTYYTTPSLLDGVVGCTLHH